MLISGDKIGQLGNRLFKFGHLIACSMENNVHLIYPYFDDYAHHFSDIRKERFIKICFHNNTIINRILLWIFFIFNLITKYFFKRSYWHENIYGKQGEINLSDPSIKMKLKKNFVIVNGWLIRDRGNFVKYSDEIKRIFQPTDNHKIIIDRFILSVREKNDILVGVHIRRGDYKNWLGGKYYYPLEVYANKCREILEDMNRLNKNIVFVLCSDSDIDTSIFDGINFQRSTGHIIEDLYILSLCNFIFGPPSTYSSWASFYGDVPLFHLQDKNQNLQINQFKIHSEALQLTN